MTAKDLVIFYSVMKIFTMIAKVVLIKLNSCKIKVYLWQIKKFVSIIKIHILKRFIFTGYLVKIYIYVSICKTVSSSGNNEILLPLAGVDLIEACKRLICYE